MITPAIRQIDKQIDANQATLRNLLSKIPVTAADWQRAWDAHPALRDRNRELWVRRGNAQLERDKRAEEMASRERRTARTKPPRKCPTCGCHTLHEAVAAKTEGR